jgi:hypothetical protein
MISVQYNQEGKLRTYTHIDLGDKEGRSLRGEQTPQNENDVFSIVPSIAGRSSLRSTCS